MRKSVGYLTDLHELRGTCQLRSRHPGVQDGAAKGGIRAALCHEDGKSSHQALEGNREGQAAGSIHQNPGVPGGVPRACWCKKKPYIIQYRLVWIVMWYSRALLKSGVVFRNETQQFDAIFDHLHYVAVIESMWYSISNLWGRIHSRVDKSSARNTEGSLESTVPFCRVDKTSIEAPYLEYICVPYSSNRNTKCGNSLYLVDRSKSK